MADVTLHHGKIALALHRLGDGSGDGDGRPLLLLHGLAERAPDEVPAGLRAWPGPVWALDFTGHGESTLPTGGGYYPEYLMADADAALGHLDEATLHGRGLGAYVALQLAGARATSVKGAILDDGPGLAGGGPTPSTGHVPDVDPARPAPPDPWALVELAVDVRPPDYATTFARQAVQRSGLATPLAVVSVARPPWLSAVADEPGVADVSLDRALERYAGSP